MFENVCIADIIREVNSIIDFHKEQDAFLRDDTNYFWYNFDNIAIEGIGSPEQVAVQIKGRYFVLTADGTVTTFRHDDMDDEEDLKNPGSILGFIYEQTVRRGTLRAIG